MPAIEEILRLPEDEQVAIMEAIREKLDDFESDEKLSDDHIAFIRQRIKSVEDSNQEEYSWEQVKEHLKKRWDAK
jgi:putative addiction module component (TIGR02574 family)